MKKVPLDAYNFMKIYINLIILVVLLTLTTAVQTQEPIKKNLLAVTFTWYMGDASETWNNALDEKLSGFRYKRDILAIAVCSTDPLPVALSMSAGNIFGDLAELEYGGGYEYEEKTGLPIIKDDDEKPGYNQNYRFYVPRNRIIFLRQNKNCRLLKNSKADVDYWIVYPNNELPEFVEARKATELNEFDVIDDNNYFSKEISRKTALADGGYKDAIKLTPEIYKTALTQIVSIMKERRTAISVIKTFYWGAVPSKTILARTAQAQKFLKDQGIGNNRIFVRKISYGNDRDMMKYNPDYPNISVMYEN
jgi:hypothetical protein